MELHKSIKAVGFPGTLNAGSGAWNAVHCRKYLTNRIIRYRLMLLSLLKHFALMLTMSLPSIRSGVLVKSGQPLSRNGL
jgi:hypothetical protein